MSTPSTDCVWKRSARPRDTAPALQPMSRQRLLQNHWRCRTCTGSPAERTGSGSSALVPLHSRAPAGEGPLLPQSGSHSSSDSCRAQRLRGCAWSPAEAVAPPGGLQGHPAAGPPRCRLPGKSSPAARRSRWAGWLLRRGCAGAGRQLQALHCSEQALRCCSWLLCWTGRADQPELGLAA